MAVSTLSSPNPAGRRATGRPAPRFRPAARRPGSRRPGRPDLGLIVAARGRGPAAVFTPNAFAAAPVKLSRANLAATSRDPRGGYGSRRPSFRPAAVRTPRPEPPGTRTRRRSGRSSHRAWASRRRVSCTSRPGSSGPACRSTGSSRVSPALCRAGRGRRGARGRRRSPADHRLGGQGRDDVARAAGAGWRAGHGQRDGHRQGRRDDPSRTWRRCCRSC